MKKLLSITLLIIAVSLGSCKEESEVSRIEKGTTKKVKALSYTFNSTQNEDSCTVKSGNSTDSTKVVSPIERKVISVETLELGGETFVASLIEENAPIETKATNPQVVDGSSIYTFYAYNNSAIKLQSVNSLSSNLKDKTFEVPVDAATKYGIIFLSSAMGMDNPNEVTQITNQVINTTPKTFTYEATFNENVCYASFDKETMPPGNPIDVTFTPVFSQLGISVPSKVGDRIITVKEVKLESGVQETANVVVTYNSKETSNISVYYQTEPTKDSKRVLDHNLNSTDNITYLYPNGKEGYYNIIPNGNDAKVKITMLLSGTPETTKSHTIDFKKRLEEGKRYTISLTNKVPISIELEDTLNIEPGQTGALTAKVKMSDGTTETIATPTTGFTWVINSPNGVVTSTKGGVVSPSPQDMVIGDNSTTNTLSLTAKADYYGSTTVTVTYGGLSKEVDVNVYRDIPETRYYMWDAPVGAYYNSTYPTDNYNPITSGFASRSCKDAPTAEEIKMYLGAGVYWVEDGPPFKTPDNKISRVGLIVKKSANITNFNADTAPKKDRVTLQKDFSTDETINKSDYFFLPKCHCYSDGSFYSSVYEPGVLGDFDSGYDPRIYAGCYWSSTTYNNTAYTYMLDFRHDVAFLYSGYYPYRYRQYGLVPMVGFDDSYVPATVEDITISPDTLNILPGEQVTLTATVTMSDGSKRTAGFDWKINSPNGVVTSTNGGVVVLGSDENIVTGNNSTTNTLSLTAGDYYGSTTVTVTYGGKSDTAAVNVYRNIPISSYYQWDAWEHYDINNWDGTQPWGPGSPTYNPTTSGTATKSCANAATEAQMQMYLGAGVYWVTDGPPFKLPDDKIYRAGLIVKKKDKIDGFEEGTAPKKPSMFAQKDFSTVSAIDKPDYFFLPASGGYYQEGGFLFAGRYGNYFSSTPAAANTNLAGDLVFGRDFATADNGDTRIGERLGRGYMPMPRL